MRWVPGRIPCDLVRTSIPDIAYERFQYGQVAVQQRWSPNGNQVDRSLSLTAASWRPPADSTSPSLRSVPGSRIWRLTSAQNCSCVTVPGSVSPPQGGASRNPPRTWYPQWSRPATTSACPTAIGPASASAGGLPRGRVFCRAGSAGCVPPPRMFRSAAGSVTRFAQGYEIGSGSIAKCRFCSERAYEAPSTNDGYLESHTNR